MPPHRLRPVLIAPIEYRARAQMPRHGREIRAAEFLPLGGQRQHVGAGQGVVGVRGQGQQV